MKVVTQSDSQVCYYGNVKKKDEDEERPRPLLFAKQGGRFQGTSGTHPLCGAGEAHKVT